MEEKLLKIHKTLEQVQNSKIKDNINDNIQLLEVLELLTKYVMYLLDNKDLLVFVGRIQDFVKNFELIYHVLIRLSNNETLDDKETNISQCEYMKNKLLNRVPTNPTINMHEFEYTIYSNVIDLLKSI